MRRSTRTKRLRTSYDDESDTPVYPEAPPSNALEKLVACLNQQTFPMASYGKIDDLVVTSLFASKRCHRYYRAMKPPSFQERWDSLLEEGNSDHSADVEGDELTQPARDADGDESALLIPSEPSFTAIHALFICKMFNKNVPPGTMPQSQTVKEVCQAVIKEMPQFFPDADMEIMEHLFFRYGLLYSQASPVKLQKVSFHTGIITAGLVAHRKIAAATPILVLSGSMSADLATDGRMISAIQAAPVQKGPQGVRIILGPFRFANHDCEPNCQVKPINSSHAYMIWAIQDIDPGSAITIRYTPDMSYFGDGLCRCTTCTGISTTAPRQDTVQPLDLDPHKKKAHRGGKKYRARKARREERDQQAKASR